MKAAIMTRVLLTGFEPFDGAAVNPSWEAVRLAASWNDARFDVAAVELPCVFGAAARVLREAVADQEPEVVVCVGQAGGRPDITIERVAVNVDDARIPDNAGNQPVDVPVAHGGPAAYFSGLPIKACVSAVRAAGLPASVSQTAGTYVCNHVFYALMHLIATEHPRCRGGFVHVPFAHEQVLGTGKPSMSIKDMAEALRVIVETAVTVDADIVLPAGALD